MPAFADLHLEDDRRQRGKFPDMLPPSGRPSPPKSPYDVKTIPWMLRMVKRVRPGSLKRCNLKCFVFSGQQRLPETDIEDRFQRAW